MSQHVPARLNYAAGVSARTRQLHRSADCDRLTKAENVRECPATHPPRGGACDLCFPDQYIDQVVKAARGER